MTESTTSNKRFRWLIITVGVLMLVTIIVQRNVNYGSDGGEKSNIRQLREKNFKKHTKKGIVMVDYWATWCRPCKAMEPILEEISLEYENTISLYKVDIDNNRNLASEYKVRLIPTLIIMVDGIEVKRFTGIQEKSTITNAIDALTIQD